MTQQHTHGVQTVEAPSELAMLGYELDGVLADFREDPTAAPDSVCIETIERVRERLAALAAGVASGCIASGGTRNEGGK